LEHRFIINGKTGTWKKADGEWKDGNFVTRLRVPIGGWHTLEVRDSRTPDHRSKVVQFGVGEVFVVAGQSNSGNYGEIKQSTKTGLVSAFDFDLKSFNVEEIKDCINHTINAIDGRYL
jgi:hypothetical protein